MNNTAFRHVCLAALLAGLLGMATVAHADLDAARKALSNSDYPAAIEALDQVLEKQPDDAEARFLKGLALARSGKVDAALDIFDTLTQDEPKMAEAWNNLGVLRARKGDLKTARDALQQAVKINPDHGPAQENLGDVYVALARNAYDRASDLEKNNSIAQAKSQQLASFIDSAAAGGTQTAGASKASGGPPPVANVTPHASDRLVVDNSTPGKAVASWAKAWSAQDVDAYLGMYSDDFEPADASSRAAWARARRKRVRAPERINVSLSNARIGKRGDQALVRFQQHYQSNSYEDREDKALLLEKTGDGWKILREGQASDVDFTVAARAADSDAASAPSQSGTQTPSSDVTMAADDGGSSAAAPSDSRSSMPASEGTDASASERPEQGDHQQMRTAVRSALQHWADAWSQQNVQGYLDAYSNDYRPQDGKSLSQWIRERRSHVSGPAWIKIDLSDIQVEPLGDGRVRATFDQHYRSNSYQDEEHKRVILVHEDGDWRIARES